MGYLIVPDCALVATALFAFEDGALSVAISVFVGEETALSAIGDVHDSSILIPYFDELFSNFSLRAVFSV